MITIPAARVHAVREGLGLTPSELARLLGVKRTTASRWEQNGAPHGTCNPAVILSVFGELLAGGAQDAQRARALARRGAETGFDRLFLALARGQA